MKRFLMLALVAALGISLFASEANGQFRLRRVIRAPMEILGFDGNGTAVYGNNTTMFGTSTVTYPNTGTMYYPSTLPTYTYSTPTYTTPGTVIYPNVSSTPATMPSVQTSGNISSTTMSAPNACMAACLSVCARKKEECAAILEPLARNSEVKELVRKEAKEARECLAELKRIGFTFSINGTGIQQAGNTDSANLLSEEAQKGFAIENEIADVCIANVRKDLEKLDGSRRDKAIVGCMTGEHMQMRNTLVVYRKYATGDFAKHIEDAQKKCDVCLKDLKDLMIKLDESK